MSLTKMLTVLKRSINSIKFQFEHYTVGILSKKRTKKRNICSQKIINNLYLQQSFTEGVN